MTSWASDSVDLEDMCLAIMSTLRAAARTPGLLGIRGRNLKGMLLCKVADTDW